MLCFLGWSAAASLDGLELGAKHEKGAQARRGTSAHVLMVRAEVQYLVLKCAEQTGGATWAGKQWLCTFFVFRAELQTIQGSRGGPSKEAVGM